MLTCHHIPYAGTGMGDETEGLKQALSLARHKRIGIRIVLVYPMLPRNLEERQETFAAFLLTVGIGRGISEG